MGIKARLSGHAFDLDDLVEHFGAGDPGVSKDMEVYYLTSADLDAVSGNAGEMQRVGRELVERINAVGWLLNSEFQPVSLADHFEEDTGAGVQHHVVLSASASARARMNATVAVVAADGSTSVLPPPKSTTVDYIALAKGHAEVAEVLELLGASAAPMNWVDLYKIYEIIRDHAGGGRALEQKGWAPKSEIGTFTRTANHPAASGPAARHARMGTTPPTNPMTLEAGRAFIRKLVQDWMASLD